MLVVKVISEKKKNKIKERKEEKKEGEKKRKGKEKCSSGWMGRDATGIFKMSIPFRASSAVCGSFFQSNVFPE